MSDELDRIERDIDIDAPASRVWELITRPGWFINDGAIFEQEVERRADDLHIVRDPVYGDFPIRTERLDPPRYAAYRCLIDEPGGEPRPEGSTLIEFWIDENPAGGVTLRVAESGFATLPGTAEERRRRLADNLDGWQAELAAARSHLDSRSVQRASYLAAPPEQVWPILTRPEHFATWYAFDGASFDPVPGSAMELRWAEHGTFRGEVVEVDEPWLFAYRIAAAPDIEPAEHASTLVTFRLKKSGNGCLLTVTQTGFDALDPRFGAAPENAATEVTGWEGGLAALGQHLRSTLTAG
ncbi:SRPBCC domain-containing protein [Solwaraspora sp. WMMD1047]|uniref:SRPBCC domain-containing protein n=1 Tax=Solwaraspora sp. WMMD1047 TaxID=3016102 RepID=UPI0024173EB6|nr:SRPBCC domain-containing protein [Solwaraspora sp. WMMD1047]MDG4834499.1 SRPBCC domain-containing protein [Solwaraspora sp. WMMD1047]